jgi:uncharacterized protein (DUF1330 family)
VPYGGKAIVVGGPFEVIEGMVHPKAVVVVVLVEGLPART